MQIEALMLLEELVLAKHSVPASELWQALHVTWGAAEQGLSWSDVSAENFGKRHITRETLSFCKTKISTSSICIPACSEKSLKLLQFPCDF